MNVYVLLDWSEGDETSTIIGVYDSLASAQASRPNAEWEYTAAWDGRSGRHYPDTWQSTFGMYTIEQHALQTV